MKRSIIILLLAVMCFAGCKTKKNVIVNVRPEFDIDVVWTLSAMRDKEMVYDDGQPKVTLQVNPEAGTINGKNGCNRYFGNIKILDDRKMELSEIGSTKMACPESMRKVESSFMQLLRKCDRYELDAESLRLMQGDKVLLTFIR